MTDREKTCKECIHNEMCYATHTDDSPCCCDFKDKSKWKEQKRGEWEVIMDDYDCEMMRCSACGEDFYDGDNDTVDTLFSYCPNCGAYMRGKEE